MLTGRQKRFKVEESQKETRKKRKKERIKKKKGGIKLIFAFQRSHPNKVNRLKTNHTFKTLVYQFDTLVIKSHTQKAGSQTKLGQSSQ